MTTFGALERLDGVRRGHLQRDRQRVRRRSATSRATRRTVSAEVDKANDTLYTANYDNTISAFDLRHCNAGDLRAARATRPGS